MIKKIAIIFLWILHISALIGIAIGYSSFFYPKSFFTLCYLALLTICFFPVNDIKKIVLFALCFITGMSVEWIGVHTGLLFGEYHYGVNIGWKIDGIPLLIGTNWALLIFITHEISGNFIENKFLKPLTASGLMVFLDFFLEQICDEAGFWHFTDGAGWYNYFCWFIIATLLHILLQFFQVKGDYKLSLHLYTVQLIFAFILWMIISI